MPRALNIELLRIWKEIGVTIFFITHSISEALFLSDKIVLLTPRPGRIHSTLDVAFARPREKGLRESKEFQEVVRWLRREME